MDHLTKLLSQETAMWPWNLKNQRPDAHRIKISNKKFDLRVRVYSTRLEIENLYIQPQYRRKKLGTAIVTALKKYALVRALSVQANYPTPWSEKFWSKLQFQKQESHAWLLT